MHEMGLQDVADGAGAIKVVTLEYTPQRPGADEVMVPEAPVPALGGLLGETDPSHGPSA